MHKALALYSAKALCDGLVTENIVAVIALVFVNDDFINNFANGMPGFAAGNSTTD
jgi:hypothetical protein